MSARSPGDKQPRSPGLLPFVISSAVPMSQKENPLGTRLRDDVFIKYIFLVFTVIFLPPVQ